MSKTYERRVLKPFKGKEEDGKVFVKGDKFEGTEKRINGLVEKGYLSGNPIKTMQEKQDEVNQESQEQKTNYKNMTVDELKKETEKENLEVEPTGKDGSAVKADYIKALEK